MASNLRVDTILPSTGTNVAIGTASGSVTFLGNTNITTSGALTAGSASITGNLGIGGTLTYEDVTNIDSVGLITARSGIRIAAGSTVGPVSGIITYFGDGSQLTGISVDSTKIETGNTKVETIDTGSDGHVKFSTEGGERLRIGPAGQLGIAGANYGTSGQFLQSQGTGSAVQWASVSSDMQVASWRVTSGWSGNTDPIQNFTQKNNNITMGYSSGIFSFPSTGYWHIMMQTYQYYNGDQDNIELHLMATTNNSSYTTRAQAYAHMNNDDGGNLYTTIQVNHVFDVTDVSTHKVKFKTAGTSATFHTSAHRDESYAIFKRLAAT